MVKELEEKHTSDLDNESESTEEEGAMRDPSPSESSVRKRTLQVQNTTEGT